MKTKSTAMPTFKSESDEADWWASTEGRSFVKQKPLSRGAKGKTPKGSPLVERLRKTKIALRLPETDLAIARRIATRKGIGYQTLLTMLLHEGLQRESRRQ
jgi:hypothetical protein